VVQPNALALGIRLRRLEALQSKVLACKKLVIISKTNCSFRSVVSRGGTSFGSQGFLHPPPDKFVKIVKLISCTIDRVIIEAKLRGELSSEQVYTLVKEHHHYNDKLSHEGICQDV